MLRARRLLLAPRVEDQQRPDPAGRPCQYPPPGASRSWGVLVPLGMEGVKYAGTGRGCPEGVGQSSPPPGHEGQCMLEKLNVDPLCLGWCTPSR